MRQPIYGVHDVDPDGNPSGGTTQGIGIDIRWQSGPLGREPNRRAPNGAFVEGVIEAALDRLRFYQEAAGGRFACEENARAIGHLEEALAALDERTAAREARGVEGTHAA